MVAAFKTKRTELCKGFIHAAIDFLAIPKFCNHRLPSTPEKMNAIILDLEYPESLSNHTYEDLDLSCNYESQM